MAATLWMFSRSLDYDAKGHTMRYFIAFLAAVIVTAVLTSAADAGVVWNMNASSCRASDTAIQAGSYSSSGGLSVGFRGTTISPITMYCPVLTVGQDIHTGKGSTINFIGVSGHPAEAGPSITAQLVRVSKNNGALSDVGKPVTLEFVSPGLTLRKTGGITHQFDFTQFFYYVRVDIARTSPTQSIAFYVVDLST